MTKQLIEQIGRFVNATGLSWQDYYNLRRVALRLQRLGERACNGEGYGRWGEWTEKDDEKDNRYTENAMRRAMAIVEPYGMCVYHQSDPRGWQLYVYRIEDVKAYNERTTNGGGIDSCYNSIGFGVPQ